MRRALSLLLLLAVTCAPAAAADGGKLLVVNGVDTAQATTLATAIRVNATGDARVEFHVARWPGPDATAARVVVGLLLADDLEQEVHAADAHAVFRSNEANRFALNASLGAVPYFSAGVFRLHVRLLDSSGSEMFAHVFLVRVEGAAPLTAQSVVVAALSLALCYGVGRLLRDVVALLGFLPSRRKQEAPAAAPEPAPTGFLHALREAPSLLRVAGLALSVAAIAVLWGHTLGVVPLGQEAIDQLVDKAETALLVAGLAYASFVGVHAWQLRRAAPTARPADEP